ncbi:hypothetical protein CHH27_08080 [Labrenzia sp. VG12]|nr:hypothetical protein CHH27_08080 [Labrenzia sp. VG12]
MRESVAEPIRHGKPCDQEIQKSLTGACDFPSRKSQFGSRSDRSTVNEAGQAQRNLKDETGRYRPGGKDRRMPKSFNVKEHVAHMEAVMHLTIEDNWRPVVEMHIAAIEKAAEQVLDFPMDADIEAAPVFVP